MDDTKRTEIAELGEFGLIDRICAPFEPQQKTTVKGCGDDAAYSMREIVTDWFRPT